MLQGEQVPSEEKVISISDGTCELTAMKSASINSLAGIVSRLAFAATPSMVRAFIEHRRKNAIMANVAHALSPSMLSALAHHFRDLNPPPLGGGDSGKAVAFGKRIYAEGIPESNVPACSACHGPDAGGQDQIPRLAGQLPDYFYSKLVNWNEERGQNRITSFTTERGGFAGFTGMETGRRFPMDMAELGPILKKHSMSVCGGWFSGTILDAPAGVINGSGLGPRSSGAPISAQTCAQRSRALPPSAAGWRAPIAPAACDMRSSPAGSAAIALISVTSRSMPYRAITNRRPASPIARRRCGSARLSRPS